MFRILSVITLLCCILVQLLAQEALVADSTLKSVLTALNSKNQQSFVYSLPAVASQYYSWKNDSTDSSIGRLELRLDKCDSRSSCVVEHVICELHREGNFSNAISCFEKEREPHSSSQPGYNHETSDPIVAKSETPTNTERLPNNESSLSDDLLDEPVVKQDESNPELLTADYFNIEKYLESLIESDNPEGDGTSTEKFIDSKTGNMRPTEEDSLDFNAVEQRPVEEEAVFAKKAFCLGCTVDLNVENPDLSPFIDQALKSIDESTENSFKHGLVKLHKAQRQVVNGIVYMLLLDVGETTCLKDSKTDRNICSLNLKSDPSTCYIEIFEKPGLEKERKVTYNNCTEVTSRYPTNDVIAPALDTSIFNTKTVPSHSATNEKFQTGSLDDMAIASVNENIYRYAGDYMEDSEPFPFLGLELVGYLSDPAEYYYNNMKQNLRMKRAEHSAFVGALKEIGPEEKRTVDELAAVAMETLDYIDEDNLKRVVVEVVDAKKQIMSGVMYHLKVVVATTSCDENQPMTSNCLKELVLPLSVCAIQLHRSFIDNSPRVQVVKSECSPKEEVKTAEMFNSRNIKDTVSSDTDVQAVSPQILKLSHFALAKINSRLNSVHTLLDVINIHTEIRNNIKTYITLKIAPCTGKDNENSDCVPNYAGTQICNIKVSDRPWLNDRQINQISCSPVTLHRKRRSVQHRRLVGAPGQIDTEDSRVKNVLAFAVEELNKQTDSNFKRKAVKVLDAKVQVVAGALYHLTIETSDTTCLKNAPESAEECGVKDSSKNQICKVKVLVQDWRDHRELTSSHCSGKPEAPPEAHPENRKKRAVLPVTSKQPSLGGLKKIERDYEAFTDIATLALHEIDRKSNSARRKKIINIFNIQSQIVEGVKYHLDMEVSNTNCLKRTRHPIENCAVAKDLEGQICHVEVWERPWMNIREVTKLSCTTKPRKKFLNEGGMNSGEHEIHLSIFRDFMSKYNKAYKNYEEMQKRLNIFKHNLVRIEQLQKTEQGTGKYGITQFADLTAKEFKQKYLGLNLALRRENEVPMAQAQIPEVQLPVEFDWRHYNVVTPVKNQGACGSCWAFSVTGNVEGQWAIQKGELLSLSEQELVDCDTLDSGCEGGLPDNAYRAIEKLGGLETEKDYPYEGENEQCHFNKSEVKVKIQGAVNITSNETKMAQWLVKNGPISIGINANAMQFYVGGVSHPWKFLCDPNDLDHGVLIVGYGVHKTYFRHKILPYWIVKNSWGTFWGEKGYYRVYRGDGTCGVNMMASSAIVN